MNNRSHRHEINRPRPRHGLRYIKCRKCHNMMMLICITQHLITFEVKFMKKLSDAKAKF